MTAADYYWNAFLVVVIAAIIFAPEVSGWWVILPIMFMRTSN